MELTNVYNQLGILFMLMLIGYILGKRRIMNGEIVKNFTAFIVRVALPMMIINGMIIPLSTEKIKQSVVAFSISVGVYLGTYVLAIMLPKLITKEQTARDVYSFAIMFSNVGFMGYPVLSAIFGEEAIFIGSIYNISFNVLLYTLGIKFAKGGKEEGEKFDPKLLINPGTVACIIGFLLFITAFPVPEFVKGSLEAVGGLCTPLSMLVIGAMLSELPLGGVFKQGSLYIVTLIRLLVVPCIVLVILKFVLQIQDPLLIGIPVIIAGMPVASNAAMMMKQYEGDSALASKVILVTTLFSGITIPILAQML